jgi:hypothetical protein
MITPKIFRRDFLGSLAAGLFGSAAAQAQRPRVHAELSAGRLKLPRYALAQNYRSLKQSSYDRSGGNADARPIPAGATLEVFQADGPGVITHIWFTIAAPSSSHLKENVLRIYWDGNTKPSVEAPVGDFFGLNLAEYFVYQPAFLNCSSVKALNCYFAMPYQRSARISITNQGTHPVNAFITTSTINWPPPFPPRASTSTPNTGRPRPTARCNLRRKKANAISTGKTTTFSWKPKAAAT